MADLRLVKYYDYEPTGNGDNVSVRLLSKAGRIIKRMECTSPKSMHAFLTKRHEGIQHISKRITGQGVEIADEQMSGQAE